ncbi:MAG: 3-deoxy-D-manno-octulosonic acid kinase [Pseudomonadota bacterium]
MNSTQIDNDNCHILYDADCLGHVDGDFFDPQYWAERGLLLGEAPGRGTTVLVQHGEQPLALRHYHRGGLPATLSRDRYLWLGLERSRPWLEWQLLQELYRSKLPVPRPVAARVCRHGPFYRGDIVTEVVAGETLAAWLGRKRLSGVWLMEVGAVLRRFHEAGVFHADLNARNILLDEHGRVTLLDFDRSERRRPAEAWQRANLARLKRSLDKFRREQRHFAFDDEDWKALLRGYEAGGSQ